MIGAGILGKPSRFRLDDPDMNAREKFPEVMAALKVAYPDYDFLFDWQKERWACIRWLGPERPVVIFHVENTDGTPADPSMDFIDHLIETDYTRLFASPEALADFMDRRDDAAETEAEIAFDIWALERRREFLEMIRRDAARVQPYALTPMSHKHVKHLQRDIRESMTPRSTEATA